MWDIHIVYKTFTYFQITGSDDVIFRNNWSHFDIFGGILIFPEVLIIWSHAASHFNQKTQVMGVIVLKYSIMRTGSCLKCLFFIYNGHNNKVKDLLIRFWWLNILKIFLNLWLADIFNIWWTLVFTQHS